MIRGDAGSWLLLLLKVVCVCALQAERKLKPTCATDSGKQEAEKSMLCYFRAIFISIYVFFFVVLNAVNEN